MVIKLKATGLHNCCVYMCWPAFIVKTWERKCVSCCRLLHARCGTPPSSESQSVLCLSVSASDWTGQDGSGCGAPAPARTVRRLPGPVRSTYSQHQPGRGPRGALGASHQSLWRRVPEQSRRRGHWVSLADSHVVIIDDKKQSKLCLTVFFYLLKVLITM